MTFKKDGRLHRVAFNWNLMWREEHPEKTGICELFWLTAFAIFLAWPVIFLGRIFGWIVRIVGAVPAFILFGYKPAGTEWRAHSNFEFLPFQPISCWPKWRGHRIELGKIISSIALVAIIGLALWVFLVDFLLKKFFLGDPLGNILGILIICSALFFWARSMIRNSEGWQMTKGFIKAKKSRFCPIVEFK